MIMFKYPAEKTDLTLIDDDNYFRITKKSNEEKLIKSIKNTGILEPPVLLKLQDRYTIISGFNRINVLKKLGEKYAEAVVIAEIDRDDYIRYNILKILRGEIGPVGKIKFILILKKYFSMADNEIEKAVNMNAAVPENIFRNESVMNRIIELPETIKDYADWKDLSYKIIKNIIKLPTDVHSLICRWLGIGLSRVNIFKEIIDMIYDIIRRDNNTEDLFSIDCGNCEDRRKFEECLFKSIFKLRYPDYSRKKENADRIIRELSDNKLVIDFPEFFEKESILIKLTVSKDENPDNLADKILTTLGSKRFKELLSLL